MTLQEIFDHVKNHLLKQDRRSLGPTGYAAYRGQDGCKCAIGCLLPDDVYSTDMEGKSVRGLIQQFPRTRPILGDKAYQCDDTTNLLTRLQDTHDCFSPQEWPEALSSLAEEFKLNY